MNARWKRIAMMTLALILLVGLLLGAWFVDRMAVRYLTGQRRIPGQDWFGRKVRMEGPPPGYLFLGFSRPAAGSAGFELLRPADQGLEAGLKPGDVVLSVNGTGYSSSFDLVSDLLSRHNAGESVPLKIRRDGEDFEITAELHPFLRTPADLDLAYEDVEFRSRSGHLLRGWFLPPPEGSDGRAVVFVHGANSSRFQALDSAPYWHRAGYGLLTMDLSGRGTSEGDYVTYTYHERWDVRSMVEWLEQRLEGTAGRIAVFGTSNGAASAIYAAVDLPTLPALVLDAPYSDLWATAGEMLGSRGVQPALLPLLGLAVRFRAGVDLKSIRPLDAIGQVSSPVLFIHGDSDTQVLPYHSERMHQLRLQAGLPSRRMVIPGGEHGFDNYPPPEQFWGEVVHFCDEQLGGSSRVMVASTGD